MICLKICTFVVSKTTKSIKFSGRNLLWFAWKSVPLWYLKQLVASKRTLSLVVICLKICTFVVSKTTSVPAISEGRKLWFAWKSVPLWYLKQRLKMVINTCLVVICLKICTFVVSKTTRVHRVQRLGLLWFAWKSVPLWYLKQRFYTVFYQRCVVICLKICTFVVSKTT